jgi:phosphate transport system substrate-binding protein
MQDEDTGTVSHHGDGARRVANGAMEERAIQRDVHFGYEVMIVGRLVDDALEHRCGKGNEGVSAYVRQITGGIGYVEYAYALQNKLAYARLKNASGKFLLPDAGAFAAAAETADWTSAKDFNVIMTNAPGDEAWPITATTWAIMYKKAKKPAQSKATVDFFKWSFEHGQPQASALDYVPLPAKLVQQIETYWTQNLKY